MLEKLKERDLFCGIYNAANGNASLIAKDAAQAVKKARELGDPQADGLIEKYSK